MTKKRKKPSGKGTRDVLSPACYRDAYLFDREGNTCKTCPFFYPCGANAHGQEFAQLTRANRKNVEMIMAQKKIPFSDAVYAISTMFGVTKNAANLSFSRRKKKV